MILLEHSDLPSGAHIGYRSLRSAPNLPQLEQIAAPFIYETEGQRMEIAVPACSAPFCSHQDADFQAGIFSHGPDLCIKDTEVSWLDLASWPCQNLLLANRASF